MPYVPLPALPAEARLKAAERRWAWLEASRPDLGPAIAVQRELLKTVIDVLDTLERGRLSKLSLPPKYLAAKILRGVPALAAEPLPVPVPLLRPALVRFCDVLARGGAGDSAAHIRTQLTETRLDATSLLGASVRRDQSAIRTGAIHGGLAPDLLWLVAEMAASPFVHALQRTFLESAAPGSPLGDALNQWPLGFCPFCASWPALAEVVAGRRVLRCSFCSLAWEPSRYSCAHCRTNDERLVTLAPDENRPDRRLELCACCKSYLKAIDVQELAPFPLLAISDLETMDLDLAAADRGYGRPALKDFAQR
jgi:FdhE protein